MMHTNPQGVYIGTDGMRSLPFHGYISDMQFSKGCRYTANFTHQPHHSNQTNTRNSLLWTVGNAFYDSSDPPGDNGFILPDGVTITPAGVCQCEGEERAELLQVLTGLPITLVCE